MILAAAVLFQVAGSLAVTDDPVRLDQDILHYHVSLVIPDAGRAISGAVTVRYAVRSGRGPLVLDFDSALVVDSVVTAGRRLPKGSAAGWRGVKGVEGWELRIAHWGRPGDQLEVAVFYHGEPREGLLIRENLHGARTAFAENWPNRARHWFPSEDHPSDKATVSFEIEVPEGWRAIANGGLRGVDSLEGGRTRWRWGSARRISTSNVVIGAARFAVREIGAVNALPQSVWTFPEDSAYAVGPFRRARDMVEAYSRLIGPFPYEKLTHVEASTSFGGMENASAIFYAERGFATRTLDEETVAHEIAHQWFGDAVTHRDWHHLWLSEGFASYLGPLYFELAGEADAFRAAMERNRRVYMSSDVVDRPIIDPTERRLSNLLNANNYPKGAWVLHMLRGEMGDSAFFDGLRAFYAGYRDSTAVSADFAAVMEQYAARPLEPFFRQWLLQPGYPKLDVSWRHAGTTLTIEVSQTQPAAWGLFELTLPLRVVLPTGERVDIDAPVAGRKSVVEREVSATPKELLVDPEGRWLLEAVVRPGTGR